MVNNLTIESDNRISSLLALRCGYEAIVLIVYQIIAKA